MCSATSSGTASSRAATARSSWLTLEPSTSSIAMKKRARRAGRSRTPARCSRAIEPGRQPRLVDEHVDEVGLDRELRQDALERDALLEAVRTHALGDEDLGHAAGGEPSLDQIRLVDGVAQPFPLLPRDRPLRRRESASRIR